MDIAVADINAIVWYENDGSENFTERTVVSGLTQVTIIHVADINGDGDMDVLGVDSTLDDIFWYENDGSPSDGGWTQHMLSASFTGARSVYAADIDTDGDLDILGAARDTNIIAWWENDGSESFPYHAVDGDFAGAVDVYAIDIDSDNNTDILGAAFTDNEVTWWKNDGNENFTEYKIADFNRVRSIHAADIDGDNDIDVVATGDSSNKITWWANDGTPANGGWVAANVTDSHNGWCVQAIDIDSDGDTDILTGDDGNDDVEWFDNDGNENFTQRTIDDNYTWPFSVHAADIDQDGWNDVVAVDNTGNDLAWWENLNAGQGPVPPIPELPTLVLVGGGLVALAGYLWFRGRRCVATGQPV
jgi:hypothetical protein